MGAGGEQNLTGLARERNRLLNEILNITAAEDFSKASGATTPEEEEDAVNRFSWLYARREGIVEKIKGITARIAESGDSGGIAAETAEGGDIAQKIASLDRIHMANAEKLTDKIKARLKDIHTGRAATAAYRAEGGFGIDVTLFDETH